MWLRGRVAVPEGPAGSDGAGTFALERFGWEAPDRLEVAGTFSGLGADHVAPPVLVLRGAETHRLSVVPGNGSPVPRNDIPWRGSFAWREPPAPFDEAALEIGDRVVALPAMDAVDAAAAPVPLRLANGGDAEVSADPLERFRAGTELLVARDEARDAHAALDEAQIALERAREDLEHERRERAADAKRFRESLDRVRASADAMLLEQEQAGAQLVTELGEAREALAERDAEVAGLRSQVGEARDALAERDAEVAGLRADVERERFGAEATREEAERLRVTLAQVRDVLGRS